MIEAEDDAREELVTLIAALRAHLEWQAATGASALPRTELGARLEPAPARAIAEAAPAPRFEAPPIPSPPPSAVQAPPAPLIAEANRSDLPPREAIRPELIAQGPTPEIQGALEALRLEVVGCDRCVLSEARTQTVFARGDARSRLCFVGEGPGADEDAQGLPFVGAAGQLLDRMISAMGLSRDEVYVCNIVKCRPPKNRKPTPEEMQACRGHLERQLELIDPAVIVALGATAVEGLLGTSGGITKLRGRWRLWRGKVAVMPTFHPAYLLRTPAAKREVWEDLQQVLKHLGRELPARQ